MLLWPMERHRQAEAFSSQATGRRSDGVACHHDLSLSIQQVDLRVDDVSLTLQHVQSGALADVALFDNATKCEPSGRQRLAVGTDGFNRSEVVCPGGSNSCANLITRHIDVD